MKSKQLQKFLIKLGIVCLGIILGLGVVYYGVSSYEDSLVEQIAQIKSKTLTNDSKARILQVQVNDAKDALNFYNDFSGSGNSDPQNFRREFAKTLLTKLMESNHIINPQFSMEQFAKMSGDYDKPTVSVYSSKMTVHFSAITDVDAFNFLKNISEAFPGDIKVVSYDITRSGEINDDNLIKLSSGTLTEGFVNGTVIFEWRSIQDNPDYKPNKTPGDGQMPGTPGAPGGPQPGQPGQQLPPQQPNPNLNPNG